MSQARYLFDRIVEHFNLQRFFRGDGPSRVPVTLTRNRVYILPTREGLIFGLLLVAMLAAATNYNNGIVYLLTFLLAGLGVMAMWHTYRNLVGLTFTAGRVAPVFAGEQLRFHIQVSNASRRDRLHLLLELNEHGPGLAPLAADLTGGDASLLVLPCPAPHRGEIDLGRFSVSSRFPLGLFRSWSYLDLDTRGLVYPRPASATPLPPLEGGRRRSQPSTQSGQDDFRGLRQHIPQDSPSHVHWKAAARGDTLLTKEFAGESGSERWLTWDQTNARDTEARLSQLCRWLLTADESGDAYGLKIPGTRINPDRGEEHLRQCLTALALFPVDAG